MLDSGDNIGKIRYFTADVKPREGDEEAPLRQSNYFRALKTIPSLEIHKGKFLARQKCRPLVGQEHRFVDIHDTEEKGSDVNLASFLLLDAIRGDYDVALVMSQDTDLLEPLRIVKEEFGKKVVVTWFEEKSRHGKRHAAVTDAVRYVHNTDLRLSQFSNPVIGRGGTRIWKPASW